MKLYGQHLPSIHDTKQEASSKLLNGLWQLDTRTMPSFTHTKYVYFFPDECRFSVVQEQLHRHLILKVGPFNDVAKEKAIEIVAFKYPFAQIVVGVFVTRRLITANTFIDIVINRPDWFRK